MSAGASDPSPTRRVVGDALVAGRIWLDENVAVFRSFCTVCIASSGLIFLSRWGPARRYTSAAAAFYRERPPTSALRGRVVGVDGADGRLLFAHYPDVHRALGLGGPLRGEAGCIPVRLFGLDHSSKESQRWLNSRLNSGSSGEAGEAGEAGETSGDTSQSHSPPLPPSPRPVGQGEWLKLEALYLDRYDPMCMVCHVYTEKERSGWRAWWPQKEWADVSHELLQASTAAMDTPPSNSPLSLSLSLSASLPSLASSGTPDTACTVGTGDRAGRGAGRAGRTGVAVVISEEPGHFAHTDVASLVARADALDTLGALETRLRETNAGAERDGEGVAQGGSLVLRLLRRGWQAVRRRRARRRDGDAEGIR